MDKTEKINELQAENDKLKTKVEKLEYDLSLVWAELGSLKEHLAEVYGIETRE